MTKETLNESWAAWCERHGVGNDFEVHPVGTVERLRAEVAAKDKFVKEAVAACSDAGRLRELLRQCRSIAALSSFTAEYTREKVSTLLAQIDAALGGEKK